MSIRKNTACTFIFAAAVINCAVLIAHKKRIDATEERLNDVECDLRAKVTVESMRTVLPFPGDPASTGGKPGTRRGRRTS